MKADKKVSFRRQCELLSLTRSNFYYQETPRLDEDLLVSEILDIYQSHPAYGYRRITDILRRRNFLVNRKRVQRLMGLLNIKAICPGPNTSKRNHSEMVYPYLLRELEIVRLHQVWQIDITYLRVEGGFVYLVGLIDVYSRTIVGWRLSNSLSNESCIAALEDAIVKYGKPEIVNSDQGCQFTSQEWLEILTKHSIIISMTGKGRSNDNAYIERFWRTAKYEWLFINNVKTIKEVKIELPKLIKWYNYERPHQGIGYLTPKEKADGFMDKLRNLPTIPHLNNDNLNAQNCIILVEVE